MPIVLKSGCPKLSEPWGLVQICTGIVLPLPRTSCGRPTHRWFAWFSSVAKRMQSWFLSYKLLLHATDAALPIKMRKSCEILVFISITKRSFLWNLSPCSLWFVEQQAKAEDRLTKWSVVIPPPQRVSFLHTLLQPWRLFPFFSKFERVDILLYIAGRALKWEGIWLSK